MVGQNDFFYKIRWLVNSILALEPKFHADWSKNGHATRKMPKIDTLDALEEHEEHEDDYQTNSN